MMVKEAVERECNLRFSDMERAAGEVQSRLKAMIKTRQSEEIHMARDQARSSAERHAFVVRFTIYF